jgi:hypothetical protein
VPWFLACNKERYPYWYGEADPRNKILLKALQSGSSPMTLEERQKLFPYIPHSILDRADRKRELLRLFFTPADKNGVVRVHYKNYDNVFRLL